MKRLGINYLILTLTLFIIPCESYRILGIFPYQSRSHQMLFDGIAKGLARKGHQIDLMTVYSVKRPIPNYKVVVNLQNVAETIVGRWNVSYASKLGDDTLPLVALPYGNGLCEYLALPEVQRLIKNPPKDPPYDLVIVESFGANCFIGLGYALKVPVVMASSTIDMPWLAEAMGQPGSTAFFPNIFTSYSHPMSFFNRLCNTLTHHITRWRYRYYIEDVQNAQMRKYISPDIPPLWELEKNVVLALVNSFHSLSGVRPLTPSIIEVGGLHVRENYEEISEDLEKWMNESTSGVVYFTMGSLVNVESFPPETMRDFYTAFRKIAPIRVLMKISNNETLVSGLPDNVKISPWIPQVAVLSHKNTRAFITHGGLMSTQEAVTFGIPMIGIPLFGDQPVNIRTYVRKNMALVLDVRALTEEGISDALNKILYDQKYKKAAEFESRRFLDRPLSAVDTAVYWIEYAIRHGSGALRSPAVDMPWWKEAVLDVYAFIFITFIIIIFLLLILLRVLLTPILRYSHKRVKTD